MHTTPITQKHILQPTRYTQFSCMSTHQFSVSTCWHTSALAVARTTNEIPAQKHVWTEQQLATCLLAGLCIRADLCCSSCVVRVRVWPLLLLLPQGRHSPPQHVLILGVVVL